MATTSPDCAGFHVTTDADICYDTRQDETGTAVWTVTSEDLAAGRFLLETPQGAAARIARERHLDALELTHRDALIVVSTGSVTPIAA